MVNPSLKTDSDSALQNTIHYLYSSGLGLIILVWLLMFSWHPAVIGFYYDDWSVMVEGIHHGRAFSSEMLQWFLTNNIDRPMQGVTHFFFTSLLGNSAVLWQWMQSLSVLGFGILYFYFLKALFRLFKFENSWVPAITASLWFLIPWITGWSLWVCTSGFLFSSLFILAFERILTAWTQEKNPNWLPALLYFVLGFYYEQYYFQFFFLFLIGYFAGVPKTVGYRSMLMTMLQLFVAQSFPFVWNRMHSHRGIASNLLVLFTNNLLNLPAQLYSSFGKLKIPGAIIIVTTLLTLMEATVRTLKNWQPERRFSILGLIGVCCVGSLYGVFFYSAGDYEIVGIGDASRTTVGMTIWLLMLIALGLQFVRLNIVGSFGKLLVLKKVLLINLFFTIPLLVIANLQQTFVWGNIWPLENKIIASFPFQLAVGMSQDAVFIYDGPYRKHGLQFFGSTWALSGAINNHFPAMKTQPHQSYYSQYANNYSILGWHPFLICGKGAIDWDGQKLQQSLKDYAIDLRTRQVWLWRVEQGKLTELKAPQQLQCQHRKSGQPVDRNSYAR